MNKKLSDRLNAFPKNHQLDHETKAKIQTALQGEINQMKTQEKTKRGFRESLKKSTIPISGAAVIVIAAVLMFSAHNVEIQDKASNQAEQAAFAVEDQQKIEELSTVWANALKTRDGKPRYEMMSREAKEKFEQEQIVKSGEQWNFVIGDSSPWVVDYEIKIHGPNAVITYKTQTSEPHYYTTQELLAFERENGHLVVADYQTNFENKPLEADEGSDKKIVWSSENNEIKLIPQKAVNGNYQGVTVEVNEMKKGFDWVFPTAEESGPQLFYMDVTGDGNEEAIIILDKGRGTDSSINEIHVLDNTDLSEIKVQNYEEVLAQQVQTEVAQSGDSLEIKVKVRGKESQFTYEYDAPSGLNQEELTFGGVVSYSVKDQRIELTVPGSVGVFPTYVADFEFIYKFDADKREFTVDQIDVEPLGE